MKLDFVVIGAQKCGTVSVRNYLRSHPGAAVPDGELAPCLVSEPWGPSRTPWSEYRASIASQLPADRIGAVDPTYGMCDVRANARSLFEHNPHLKVIYLTRPRVERAYSAWRMASLAGWEDRSFNRAIRSCIEEGPSWTHGEWLRQSYLEAGEYERISSAYAEFFTVMRIGIGNRAAAHRICDFVGVEYLGPLPHVHRTEYPDGDPGPDQESIDMIEGYYAGDLP